MHRRNMRNIKVIEIITIIINGTFVYQQLLHVDTAILPKPSLLPACRRQLDRWIELVKNPYQLYFTCAAVREEVASLKSRFVFGEGLDLDLLGIEIDDDTLVPGLAVASSRAKPLAAWMNGLELCTVEADIARGCLILSVGVSTRYTYASYNKNATTTREAEAWEAAKKDCGGLHFLAIQESLDSDDCVGFWLLLDLPPSPV